MEQKTFASNLSFSERRHAGLLFMNEMTEKMLA